jgi:hypothetical protein
MPTIDKSKVLAALCPPLDRGLTEALIDEFVSQEKRYVLRDWGPATLDGGQFAEAAARIVYHQDSGNLNARKQLDDCLEYVEDPTNKNKHAFPEKRAALHLAKVLRTLYKLRSQRGAVHIDPQYTANHIDSRLVLECVRWVFSELLRIFWTKSRSDVAATIRELAQFEVPVVGKFGDILLVQRPDCTAEEEILLLLHYAGDAGMPRSDLSKFVKKSAASISTAVARLESASRREIVRLPNGNYRLTDPGVRRVVTVLANKLIVP